MGKFELNRQYVKCPSLNMFSTACRRARDIYMKILRSTKVQICIKTADKAVLLFPFSHILKLTSESTSHFPDIQNLKYLNIQIFKYSNIQIFKYEASKNFFLLFPETSASAWISRQFVFISSQLGSIHQSQDMF